MRGEKFQVCPCRHGVCRWKGHQEKGRGYTDSWGGRRAGACADTGHRGMKALRGSGTIVGLMLVLLAAALLGALSAGASVVVARAEARQEADIAALSAASARLGLLPGRSPCEQAAYVLTLADSPTASARTSWRTSQSASSRVPAHGVSRGSSVQLVSCRVQGDDVLVTVRAGSGPFVALTQTASRAGPDDCVKADSAA